MSFTKVCTLDDIWEGEMEPFTVDGHDIILVCAEGGEIKAFQGICPHQDIALSEGKLDPMMAFMQGKLKIAGDMMIAQKLAPLLKR